MRFFALLLAGALSLPLQIFPQTSISLAPTAKFDARLNDKNHSPAKQLGFSPDGKLFFIIDYNQKVSVWETETQEQKFSLAGKFLEAEFSPDGEKLLIVSKKGIALLKIETGELLPGFAKYKDEIKFLGWNPNAESFAVGTKKFVVEVLDATTAKPRLSVVVHEKRKSVFDKIFGLVVFFRIAFTPDGEKLLAVCGDTTANLFDINTGKIIRSFVAKAVAPHRGASETPPEISDVQISRDGKWVLTSSYYDSRLWETATGRLVQDFDFYSSAAFSPNNRYLGMMNAPNSKEPATAFFDLATEKFRPILTAYSGRLVAWSPDSRYFITDRTRDERNKKTAFIWETETGRQTSALKTYANYCFDFVSTCISDNDVFKFSPDGKMLLSQNEKELKLINSENGEMHFQTKDLRSPALWSPDGKYILSGSQEKRKITLSKIVN